MKKVPSFDLDDEGVLEEIYNDVDFNFDLENVHSDVKNLLQSFVKREVIKKALKDKYGKLKRLKEAASPHFSKLKKSRDLLNSENLKQILKSKKKQLETKLQTPPFLRTSDKIAFTLGIITLCITEGILLRVPHLMSVWYSTLICPLIALRYYFYRKLKWHYFLFDFCYFAQVVLLAYIYIFPENTTLFHIVFALSNGPLAVGAVMWRNSLVFHDLDKLTSVFIHMFPPLVTFCLRWFPDPDAPTTKALCLTSNSTDDVHSACSISIFNTFVASMILYVIWQVLYLLKTEVIDKKMIEKDKEIMTSARWMSEVKPHPIWKFLKKKGIHEKYANYTLVSIQFIYTMLTLLPVIPVFNSFTLHCIYLIWVSLTCVWNGAAFYFEVFTETYSKRLKRYLKDVEKHQHARVTEILPTGEKSSSNEMVSEGQQEIQENLDKEHNNKEPVNDSDSHTETNNDKDKQL
jgi:hypothetical protein